MEVTDWRDLHDEEVLKSFFESEEGLITTPTRLRLDNATIVLDDQPLAKPSSLADQVMYQELVCKIARWLEEVCLMHAEGACDDAQMSYELAHLRAARQQRIQAYTALNALRFAVNA